MSKSAVPWKKPVEYIYPEPSRAMERPKSEFASPMFFTQIKLPVASNLVMKMSASPTEERLVIPGPGSKSKRRVYTLIPKR